MADASVLLAMRAKSVVGELQRPGYPIVDRRGSPLSDKLTDNQRG